ncbi:unnamed protein product [Linum trigynum]|uniref:Uncharacterized protein n=1 Tax=Linum trigynum TaxID=586398 RepID=A0AAV2EAM4_9ROSI
MQVTRWSRRGSPSPEKGNSSRNHDDPSISGKIEKGKNGLKSMEGNAGNKGGQKDAQRVESLKFGNLEKGKVSGSQQKGKEKVGKGTGEVATGGKGVMGPIPLTPKENLLGQNRTTTESAPSTMMEIAAPNFERKNINPKPADNANHGPPSFGPPSTKVLTGPNNTSIQIVDVQQYVSKRNRE